MRRKPIEKAAAQTDILRELKKTNPPHVNKRLMVLKLIILDEMDNLSVGQIVGLHITSVSRIVNRYRVKGIEAIVGVRHNHGNRYMTREKETEFLQKFSTLAEVGQIIEVTQIHLAYEEAVGHPVTRAAIYYLLKRHHWRKVMPRSKHPQKASDEEIDAYKKNVPDPPIDAYEQEKGTAHVSGRGWLWANQ